MKTIFIALAGEPLQKVLRRRLVFGTSPMKKDNECDLRKIAASIAVLWDPLTDAQRNYLVDSMEVKVYEKNEVIYREHEEPQCLMCLLDGKVKVYKEGIGSGTQIIRMIKEQSFFGYRAAFVEENYHTSAAALECCTICLIPFETIFCLIRENNRVAIFFIKQLAMMLGDADTLTVNLTQKHLRGRLAEALVALKDKYGVEEDGATLSIYMSREDMACMSNMTTSNAIRTLSAFATEHLVAIDGKKIKILEDNKLRNISKMG